MPDAETSTPAKLEITPGAPEPITTKVVGWYDELCSQLNHYGLPLPAAGTLKSQDDMWFALVSWAPDASHHLVCVSASFIRDGDFRAMLSKRPKRRDRESSISWNDPMWSELPPLIRELHRTLLKDPEERGRALEDWESIASDMRTPWTVDVT